VRKNHWSKLVMTYAARYLVYYTPELAASDMFVIMETSIQKDSKVKQSATKEFLIKVIESINDIDPAFADKVGKEYTNMALELLVKSEKKIKK
jgi:hypothetical protein